MTVGPAVELHFSNRWSLGVEALYKNIGHSRTLPETEEGITDHIRFRGYTWDLPIMLRYRFSDAGEGVRPFVNGGYAGRSRSAREIAVYRVDSVEDETSDFLASMDRTWDNGLMMGGGVEWKRGRMRITPEFRYSYFPSVGQDEIWKRHQAEWLIGISF